MTINCESKGNIMVIHVRLFRQFVGLTRLKGKPAESARLVLDKNQRGSLKSSLRILCPHK